VHDAQHTTHEPASDAPVPSGRPVLDANLYHPDIGGAPADAVHMAETGIALAGRRGRGLCVSAIADPFPCLTPPTFPHPTVPSLSLTTQHLRRLLFHHLGPHPHAPRHLSRRAQNRRHQPDPNRRGRAAQAAPARPAHAHVAARVCAVRRVWVVHG
jgi:hypothetical protein